VPFDPRLAVRRFAAALRGYHVTRVKLDNYAGRTFRSDFEAEGFGCDVYTKSASDLYEDLEPRLNAGEVELLDQARLVEELVALVWRGGKITHLSSEHDDWANAAAGALLQAVARRSLEPVLPDYQSGPSAEAADLAKDHEGAIGWSDNTAAAKAFGLRKKRGLPDAW
jgi:hypothetical protein